MTYITVIAFISTNCLFTGMGTSSMDLIGGGGGGSLENHLNKIY